jgi:hypothetical protein
MNRWVNSFEHGELVKPGYEPRRDPELAVATGELLLDESAEAVIALVRSRGVIRVEA